MSARRWPNTREYKEALGNQHLGPAVQTQETKPTAVSSRNRFKNPSFTKKAQSPLSFVPKNGRVLGVSKHQEK